MFHYFTIKFHFSFFASFRFKFFASLHFSNFRFEVKQSEAKLKSCEIRLFFTSKRNKIFASNSIFASEAKVRAHPSQKKATSCSWPSPDVNKMETERASRVRFYLNVLYVNNRSRGQNRTSVQPHGELSLLCNISLKLGPLVMTTVWQIWSLRKLEQDPEIIFFRAHEKWAPCDKPFIVKSSVCSIQPIIKHDQDVVFHIQGPWQMWPLQWS